MSSLVLGICITILIIILIRLHIVLSKDKNCLNLITSAKVFLDNKLDNNGFIVLIDRQLFLDDLDFYRKVIDKVRRKSKCTIVSLEKNEGILDSHGLEVLRNLHINKYPAIIYLQEDNSRVFSFESQSERQIIREISGYLRRLNR